MRRFVEAALWMLAAATPAFAQVFPGYLNHKDLEEKLRSIDESEVASLFTLGKSQGGRSISMVRIGVGKADEKPALLVVGGVESPDLVGSELAWRIAARFVQTSGQEQIKRLLDRFTIYFVPRPTPDGCERFFQTPYWDRDSNSRPMDDDRDGLVDEDPPEDLNGDGLITTMRVEEETGGFVAHPRDSRVMIPVDPTKGEKGRYSLYVEGVDNDKDEKFNEDGPGGASLNRNFTFKYPYFGQGAGPHQVSEAESRSLADFAFLHHNIAAVFCFSPNDNLLQPWKSEPGADRAKIRTSVQPDDAPLIKHLADGYQKLFDGLKPTASAKGEGAFSEWAYFHFGRWSFAARPWQVPGAGEKPKAAASDKEKETDKQKTEAVKEADAKAAEKSKVGKEAEVDVRGQEEIQSLAWFDKEKIAAFVPWTDVEHVDFPKRKVQVGGFKPFYRRNPPAGLLDGLAEKNYQFLLQLLESMPTIAIADVQVDKLDGGLARIKVRVTNRGYLPTVSQMGNASRQLYPVQLAIAVPKEAILLTGYPRFALEPIAGGGKREHVWIVRYVGPAGANATISISSPSVGTDSKTITLP